ncbi:MAG TPA: hypothetical protein VF778_12415, partial [Xanthobacteraceae bacterium]
DIRCCPTDVRFTPESGHDEALRVEWVSQICEDSLAGWHVACFAVNESLLKNDRRVKINGIE